MVDGILDLEEDLRAAHGVGARQIDLVSVNRLHGLQNVHKDRKEHDQDRHQELRPVCEPEPHDEKRRERHFWCDLEAQDVGRQDPLGKARQAEEIATDRAKKRPKNKARRCHRGGRKHMAPQIFRQDHTAELRHGRGEVRENETPDAHGRRDEFPRRNNCQTEQHGRDEFLQPHGTITRAF
jgi:hypothetical protein